MKIPELCRTLAELEEAGQAACLRQLLADRGVISISTNERRELAVFAARWLKRFTELTQDNQEKP